jgi:hypothetical protein
MFLVATVFPRKAGKLYRNFQPPHALRVVASELGSLDTCAMPNAKKPRENAAFASCLVSKIDESGGTWLPGRFAP